MAAISITIAEKYFLSSLANMLKKTLSGKESNI
jgi:hypothetical protein